MNTTAHHGVHGCYCEDCTGNRIWIDTEPANPERRALLVRTWQRWSRVRLASEVMLRRVS
jgi:hypothetical protein